MIKYAALLFNTIALLIYQFFFTDAISVSQKIPPLAKAGSEFTVEITLKKGDTDGFAKLQQDLPVGFTAEEGSTGGASFTFSNQSVKFIWMALPSDNDMNLSYKVKVDPKMEAGDKTIGGKFAYVVNNVKQQVEITPSVIKITAPEVPAVVNKVTPPANTSSDNTMIISGIYYDDQDSRLGNLKINMVNKAGEILKTVTSDKDGNFEFTNVQRDTTLNVLLDPTDTHVIGKKSVAQYKDNSGLVIATKNLIGNSAVAKTAPTTNAVNDGTYNFTNSTPEANGLICIRKTPQNVSSESFIVEVNINKANLSGFAKYVESLPPGLTAAVIDKQEASFSFADQKLKFVWVSLPTTTSFKISYKVTVNTGILGDMKIDGAFSYIENDETKKYTLPVSIVPIGAFTAKEDPVAITQPETKKAEPETKTVEPETKPREHVIAKTTEPETKKTEPIAAVVTEDKPKTEEVKKELSASTIPAPQGDVNYSVQIAALRNAKAPEVIASYFKITDPLKTEMADGFTKYTVGSHKVYKEAHDARDLIKTKGVTDAWVTAYNKGKRITVQEALMITSQKWYK